MKVVISAVNLVDGGALEILREAIRAASVIRKEIDDIEFCFLVANPDVHLGGEEFEYYYFPKCKKNWLNRLYFEYISSRTLSIELGADLWVSLHDITANVTCPQVVYCHNPSPFLEMPFADIRVDWKQYLFSRLYKFLYRIGIYKNRYVVVQQHWIKRRFEEMFSSINVLVSRPSGVLSSVGADENNQSCAPSYNGLRLNENGKYSFFYPAYPRYFKNQSIILRAARRLEKEIPEIEFILTIDGTENRYAKKIIDKYGVPSNVRLLGLIPKTAVEELYRKSSALIFPSKLETWGLPITEYGPQRKPMLIADLEYARETSHRLDGCYFFDPDSVDDLVEKIRNIVDGKPYVRWDENKEMNSLNGVKGLLEYLIWELQDEN